MLASHGAFYVLRAMLGPSFGFAAWGSSLSQGSGGVLGFETMLFAVLFGTFAIAMSRERLAEAHRQDALEDTLTGIGNRRALTCSGAALLAEAAAADRPLALLMMDLDGFKRVNDRDGHAAGDRLLRAFARLAHDYLPPTSLVCRLGGDEFVAVLPGAEPDRAQVVADELRALFAHLKLDGTDGPIAATVSIGIAQAPTRTPGFDRASGRGGPVPICGQTRGPRPRRARGRPLRRRRLPFGSLRAPNRRRHQASRRYIPATITANRVQS